MRRAARMALSVPWRACRPTVAGPPRPGRRGVAGDVRVRKRLIRKGVRAALPYGGRGGPYWAETRLGGVDEAGERLDGRYALDRLIGDGGMGQVWSAWDERMQREVAVKVVTGLYGADEAELFARFRREIRLAADLPGRHTVIAHDCGEATVDGARQPYLVMELLTGRTLLETVRERRPSPAEAVAWAGQMATALTVAHARRIVHRDIKPHNVMFSADGELKVLDFGIAKFLGDTVLGGSITRTGKQVGTLSTCRRSRRAVSGPSITGPTCTRWAVCCTSCSPGSRRSRRTTW